MQNSSTDMVEKKISIVLRLQSFQYEVHIPGESGRRFRGKAATDSG